MYISHKQYTMYYWGVYIIRTKCTLCILNGEYNLYKLHTVVLMCVQSVHCVQIVFWRLSIIRI